MLLKPPASTPETSKPGMRTLSAVRAWPCASMAIPPYVKVMLGEVSREMLDEGTEKGQERG